MFTLSLLYYPLWVSQATANDNAVLIKLGGEVTTIPTKPDSPPPQFKKISLDVVHMDIQQIVRLFAQHSEANIVIADGVSGTVSARINEEPWPQALQSIVQSNGWTLVSLGDIWIIKTIAP